MVNGKWQIHKYDESTDQLTDRYQGHKEVKLPMIVVLGGLERGEVDPVRRWWIRGRGGGLIVVLREKAGRFGQVSLLDVSRPP